LGLAYKGLKKWEKAIQSIQEELKGHPDNGNAYVELGWLYKERGEVPKALANFKKALASPSLSQIEKVQKMVSSMEAGQTR
jgi:tetratricopeptide (TPR) repeat protein